MDSGESRARDIKEYLSEYEKILRKVPSLSFGGRSNASGEHIPLELLEAIGSGIMSPAVLQQFGSHVGTCPHCQRNLDLYLPSHIVVAGQQRQGQSAEGGYSGEQRSVRLWRIVAVPRLAVTAMIVAVAVLGVISIGSVTYNIMRHRAGSAEERSLLAAAGPEMESRRALGESVRKLEARLAEVEAGRRELLSSLTLARQELDDQRKVLSSQARDLAAVRSGVEQLTTGKLAAGGLVQIGDKLLAVEPGFMYHIDPKTGRLIGRSAVAEVPGGAATRAFQSGTPESRPTPGGVGLPGGTAVPPGGPRR